MNSWPSTRQLRDAKRRRPQGDADKIRQDLVCIRADMSSLQAQVDDLQYTLAIWVRMRQAASYGRVKRQRTSATIAHRLMSVTSPDA
ncbi:hypothetical protein H257_13585 [Aphanomyces astaci]|uniref:Uncharacterized protein n=1 Tax=Aphanomyces astaci TaxID=112090 RepID=W4FX30_APHAT|nr:hypothetical protein H257_13585 [Aphanomyces astaci]ETV71203.1 hypothetical protein H257_13585 [Aphanomyces astaci]|eukprot:XP_009839449.1 hypothetical protein H257_13585 [Aphanomyces astaci]